MFSATLSLVIAICLSIQSISCSDQAPLKAIDSADLHDLDTVRHFTWKGSFYGDVDEAQLHFSLLHDIVAANNFRPGLAEFAIATKIKEQGSSRKPADSTAGPAAFAPVGPDIGDRATIINLAKMTSDAYVLDPTQPDWLNTSLKFNYSSSFGWEGDGLRGHVFADTWNKTVIVAFKGTTVFPGSKWGYKDRLNDNLLFSCCCGAQRPDPYPYQPVCDCPTDTYQCNSTCLTQQIGQRDRYYATALEVMMNVTRQFPGSDFWVVGHSLGGAIASLMGRTLNFPVVTFESPPERLPAHRLGLMEVDGPPIYHVGNTADPIFMGACNGYSSSCGIAGYSFESQCFTGQRCAYDTVEDLGWHLSITNHRINVVIDDVLEKYNSTPKCVSDDDSGCVDCYNWNLPLPG